MVLSTFQKRGLLRDFQGQALKKGKSLKAALLEILSAPVFNVQGGRVRISTGSGEFSTSYSTGVGITQVQLLEVVSELLDRYDIALAALIAAGTDQPNDDQVFASMMADLRAIKSYTSNWMYLAK